ncbi:MMPL family transporter [Bacillus horti]|uniref:RND superfamily putative drug exporter n=1 Tax=Caldalkalibacillus horti TaxID=77523 RepID=A0ABT9VTN7_9BACI|nr:MMPL family transporter [Bacillus horti]MDQ0164346.1 RND superfamily putative drug exporter [Bacillus horti]
MRSILKARWFVITAWIAVTVLLMIFMPNFNELVREKGQISVPDGYSSSYAQELLRELGGESDSTSTQIALVFHNPNDLSSADINQIEQVLKIYEENKNEFGLSSVNTHFNTPELESQFIAPDGKTILAALDVEIQGREVSEIREVLQQPIENLDLEVYLTGQALIDEDTIVSAQDGLKKTEFITVGFILIVLLLVFRSVVTPIIPLITVGFTYLVSQAIVAYLVEWVNFPLSTFTQIFLVAILFGIGTDYCILILSRYKEEIGRNEKISDAIIATYRTAGKTVFFSALAVFVGFASIGFSTFTLYRSAAAVAIGVAILVIALFTIVPFFMSVMGKKLFWPTKGSIEHKPSKFWGAMGRFSLGRPVLALALVAIIIAPFLITYDGEVSFNSLDEIGDSYESVKGFNIIADSFQPGEALPGSLVIKSKVPLDNAKQLVLLENISKELAQLDGIGKVRSVTRPTGDELEDFFVANQAHTLNSGLGDADDGLRQISDGLSLASSELHSSSPELETAINGVNELVNGTEELRDGIVQLSTGLQQIEQGIVAGSAGATQLQDGLRELQANSQQLAQAARELQAGYQEMQAGLGSLASHYEEIATQLKGISMGLESLAPHFNQLAESYPELQQDVNYVTISETVNQLTAGSKELTEGLNVLNQQFAGVVAGFGDANAGLDQVIGGNEAVAQAMNEMIAGMGDLANGLQQAAAGQQSIVQEMPQLSGGLEALKGGQLEIQQGFRDMGDQLSALTDGLDQSVDGLHQVTDGLSEAQTYLTGLSTGSRGSAGVYIPDEALTSEELQTLFDVYMSEDRYIAKFDIVFADNPYATEALDLVPEIERTLHRVVKGTDLEDIEFGISGVSGIFSDLRQISSDDYSQTVVLMLIGIFLILIVLLRSIIAPIYLILSLVLCYFTSVGITEFIFVDLLGYTGLSWATPFFGFVILVALGIDYSIFLMDRFREHLDQPIEQAMLTSMKNMGTVIISAAIILAGTFAAMLPSGMLSLLQIATIVISGLFLYAVVFLPFFVPVMVKIFGRANFWPFKN